VSGAAGGAEHKPPVIVEIPETQSLPLLSLKHLLLLMANEGRRDGKTQRLVLNPGNLTAIAVSFPGKLYFRNFCSL
jgi:hypothetical protein